MKFPEILRKSGKFAENLLDILGRQAICRKTPSPWSRCISTKEHRQPFGDDENDLPYHDIHNRFVGSLAGRSSFYFSFSFAKAFSSCPFSVNFSLLLSDPPLRGNRRKALTHPGMFSCGQRATAADGLINEMIQVLSRSNTRCEVDALEEQFRALPRPVRIFPHRNICLH